jgi:hypothetical protein
MGYNQVNLKKSSIKRTSYEQPPKDFVEHDQTSEWMRSKGHKETQGEG